MNSKVSKESKISIEIKLLALEEIERLHGITRPNPALLEEMIAKIKSWPMIQAVLNQQQVAA